ncbi:MAG: polymer-forming cytoskeletal protein, partial [Planctomycetota bacterium]|nr:polymer-forming cytoskeletal protein [Planctomycetota bacterium]
MFSPKKKPKKQAAASHRGGRSESEERKQGEKGRQAGARPESRSSRSSGSSTLNPHLLFEGNLKFTGSVLVDCEFRGSIVTNDVLTVGPSGNVEAEVSAGVVEISGKVYGNIKAKTNV